MSWYRSKLFARFVKYNLKTTAEIIEITDKTNSKTTISENNIRDPDYCRRISICGNDYCECIK